MKTILDLSKNKIALLLPAVLILSINLSIGQNKFIPKINPIFKFDPTLNNEYSMDEAQYALFDIAVTKDESKLGIKVINSSADEFFMEVLTTDGNVVFEGLYAPSSRALWTELKGVNYSNTVFIARIHHGKRIESRQLYVR